MSPRDTATPSDPETLGRTLIDAAWNEDDRGRLDDLFAHDCIIRDPSEPTARNGPDAYGQYVKRHTETAADLELRIDDATVANGTVAIQVSGIATPVGHFLGCNPDNVDGAVTFSGLEVLGVEDGTLVEWSGTLLADASVEAFVEGFQGDVILPRDDEYDESRAVWNRVIDKYPALIARCNGVADVIDAVVFARENDLLVAVSGGGHNVAGTAVCDGGLVIDLSRMKGIHIDLDAGTVRAEGGVTWGEHDRETQVFGLATPGGVVSITGIAGLTLNGGMGWLRRKYGLSIDNLVSVDIVTADGEYLTASENQNSELFWGIRGGGGNFGVVTSFEYRLHSVGPDVMFAATMYPLNRAHEVVSSWRDFMKDAPEEVSSEVIFWSVPAVPEFPEETHGEPIVTVAAMHCGPVEEGQRVLQPLRELADPLLDLSVATSYTQVQTMFDPFFPEGELCHYWKSINLDRLDDEVIGAAVAIAEDRPDPRILIPIWHQGGEMNRVDANETAYGDRSTSYMLSLDSTWENPANTEEIVAWTREHWADMHRFSDGSLYLNFPGFGEEGEELVRSAAGRENFDRLVTLKEEYDPENVFRHNQNISPSESPSGHK